MQKKFRFLKVLSNGSLVFNKYAVKKSYFIFYKKNFQVFLVFKKIQVKKLVSSRYKKKYYASY